MPNRKIPFSHKQKKEQLKDKRERIRSRNDSRSDGDDLPPDKLITAFDKSLSLTVCKIKEQPGSGRFPVNPNAVYDPNRYRLHFHQESAEEKKRRKEKSFLPVEAVPERALEMDLDDTYHPGSVLDIPIRPTWSYSMSKEELERNEQKYFREYVDRIFDAHRSLDDLSYFELNLETWRQLWRVMEISDMFLVIVDLRFPVLHFPPTLYSFIVDTLKKPMILVLNKIDLVPPPLAIAWKKYFEEKYPSLSVVIFGSAPRAAVDIEATFKRKRRKRRSKTTVGGEQIVKVCKILFGEKYDLKEFEARILAAEKGQLLAPLTKLNHPEGDDTGNECLSIGCVGEPNVGKSSVINALMGRKVVSVSKTPGHTKYFQTIYLASNVRLCDCPGLVFPATVPKVLQIIGGIYPIAQVSDPYSVIGYIAARLPLVQLLGLKHPHPETAKDGKFSPMDICEAWALKRGFLTAKAARPDVYRAGNHLLRITLDGRICFRMFPPGYLNSKALFESLPDTTELTRKLRLLEDHDEEVDAAGFDAFSSEEESSEDEAAEDLSAKSVSSDDAQESSTTGAISNRFAALQDDSD